MRFSPIFSRFRFQVHFSCILFQSRSLIARELRDALVRLPLRSAGGSPDRHLYFLRQTVLCVDVNVAFTFLNALDDTLLCYRCNLRI